jgi:hypothetical protein
MSRRTPPVPCFLHLPSLPLLPLTPPSRFAFCFSPSPSYCIAEPAPPAAPWTGFSSTALRAPARTRGRKRSPSSRLQGEGRMERSGRWCGSGTRRVRPAACASLALLRSLCTCEMKRASYWRVRAGPRRTSCAGGCPLVPTPPQDEADAGVAPQEGGSSCAGGPSCPPSCPCTEGTCTGPRAYQGVPSV